MVTTNVLSNMSAPLGVSRLIDEVRCSEVKNHHERIVSIFFREEFASKYRFVFFCQGWINPCRLGHIFEYGTRLEMYRGQINERGVLIIAINRINWNGEIWRKLLNSVAGKYDCGINFTITAGRLSFEGDHACAEEIVKEVVALLNGEA